MVPPMFPEPMMPILSGDAAGWAEASKPAADAREAAAAAVDGVMAHGKCPPG